VKLKLCWISEDGKRGQRPAEENDSKLGRRNRSPQYICLWVTSANGNAGPCVWACVWATLLAATQGREVSFLHVTRSSSVGYTLFLCPDIPDSVHSHQCRDKNTSQKTCRKTPLDYVMPQRLSTHIFTVSAEC